MFDKTKSNTAFFVTNYERFSNIPLDVLDNVNYSVYVIDYNWTYLFINHNAKQVFGDLANNVIGKSAFDVFKEPRFEPVFSKIKRGVMERIFIEVTVHSPLRGQQIMIRGYPLLDSYLFAVTTFPGRHEILDELRAELRKKKQ